MELYQYIEDFINEIKSAKIEIYNEASIQYELAIFLRSHLNNTFKIQLERNINHFNLDKTNIVKSEMDIVIFTPDKTKKYCIELKFPLNGQYPEQMFELCKDVKFLEQLVENGFDNCYSLMFAEDHLFYSGRKKDGIYSIFRGNKAIEGEIHKPTGEKDEMLQFNRVYQVEWLTLENNLKYLIIKV